MVRDVRSFFLYVGLAALVFAVYGQVVRFDFTNYDDPEYVVDNSHISNGVTIHNLAWAVTTGYASNWLPLTWMSHMLDVQLFQMNSGLHHMTSVLLHALSSMLLFAALRRMTGAFWRSALVAVFFALHPLRVESVAWIAERKDVLSTFFWMLTMWCYSRYVVRPGAWRYLLVLTAFVLGLMAKPMVVTLPFTLLLLDVWPLHRLNRSTLKLRVMEKLPLFALSAVVGLVNYLVQQNAGSVISSGLVPISLRVENALIAYAMYLRMMIWPFRLAPFYPMPMAIPVWQVIVAGVVLAALSLLFCSKARMYPYVLVGWLWYLGTLVPVLGLVLVGAQARADRYTYVPMIGVLIIVVWGISDWLADRPFAARLVRIGSILVLAAFMGLTAVQVSHWHDSVTLFRYTIEVSENNYVAYNNLGVALSRQGDLQGAIDCYQRAMSIPRHFYLADPYINMGAAMLLQSRPADAVHYLSQAVQYEPRSARAQANLGLALDDVGDTSNALSHLKLAIAIEPDNAEAQSGLSIALAETGSDEEALAHAREAVRLRPAFAGSYFDLGQVYGLLGRLGEAEQAFSESIRLDPTNARAYFNLGITAGRQGKLSAAIESLQTATRLVPNDATAWFNLGSALAQNDQIDDAVRAFSEAVRLRPEYTDAKDALDAAQLLRNRK